MNRKLQAEKQAQPAGIRVIRPFSRMILPGLVADPGIAARRAQPDLVALEILQRGLQPGNEIVVNHPFGEQYLANHPPPGA